MSRVQLPWSREGWYTDGVRRRTDPAISDIIRQAGGKANPIGFDEGRPGLDSSPASHNPYTGVIYGIAFTLLGLFVFVQLIGVLWAAILVGGFFVLSGAFVIVMNGRRIPAWHRARAAVRAYLLDHEGTFPRELRWYS